MGLAEALERYLRHLAVERGRSANTVAAYRRDLARFAAFCAERGAASCDGLTGPLLADYSPWLQSQGPLAPRSLTRMLSSVRGFARFAFLEGLTERDLSKHLTSPKQPQRLPKALTVDEVGRLLAASRQDDPMEVRNRALLEFLYATGARVSEAVTVSVDEVYDQPYVRLLGKGGKERIVPLGSYARQAIDEYLVRVRPGLARRGPGTAALFLSYRGRPLTRQSAWDIIRAAAERAGLADRVSPHTLRHSFATHLLNGGADIRVVQELLGHASISTTQIYTKVTRDAMREVYLTSHPRAGAR